MKRPQEAPKIDELMRDVTSDPGLLQRIFSASLGSDSRYWHWDELQYREPPAGLNRRDWWAGIKFRRQGLRQYVALLDKNDHPFSFQTVDPIPQKLHEIDLRAGGHVQMPEQVTNRETRDQYYVSSLIEEAITSSQLEGATTTREVAKEMLRAGRQPRDKSERMILNNYLTMRRISSLKEEPLTKELVFEIHRLVTDGTLDNPDAAGRFRKPDEPIAVHDDNGTVLHYPPPMDSLEQRMHNLCAFANQEDGPFVHPVVRSIVLHFMIGFDHPFFDGNGRTARALFYWSMLRHGYWLAEFISISHIMLRAPAQYSRAFLFTETDEGDLTYFILYHLTVIMKAIEGLYEYIARKADEVRRIEHELRGVELLNHRQRALMGHAIRHPGKRYSIEEHRASHNVSYETARSDLLDLAHRELMSAARDGKRWMFTPEPQLAGRLAALGARGTGALT